MHGAIIDQSKAIARARRIADQLIALMRAAAKSASDPKDASDAKDVARSLGVLHLELADLATEVQLQAVRPEVEKYHRRLDYQAAKLAAERRRDRDEKARIVGCVLARVFGAHEHRVDE